MAVWKCSVCGSEQENRCKPKKCACGAKEAFAKKEEAPAKAAKK